MTFQSRKKYLSGRQQEQRSGVSSVQGTLGRQKAAREIKALAHLRPGGGAEWPRGSLTGTSECFEGHMKKFGLSR